MSTSGLDKSLPAVPRSKGCLTCVSRKRRCDGTRPTCRACESRNQTCAGYRRKSIVFLNEGWRSLGVSSKARNKSKQINNTARSASCEIDKTNVDPALCQSLTIDRFDPHINFFHASFGTRPFQTLGCSRHLFRQYLQLLSSGTLDDCEKGRSLRTPTVFAVDALAYGYFGKANIDPLSVRRSFRSYGMAIECMSARLKDIKRDKSGLHALSEEDWQHFAFFCLVMTFWEMKMSPTSRNWETHMRCLTAAISLRGTNHAWSNDNFRLLASSRFLIMLQALSSREPSDWQQNSPIRSAWLGEIRCVIGALETKDSGSEYELYHSLDSLMVDVTAIGSATAQFEQLTTETTTAAMTEEKYPHRTLFTLYDTAETILRRTEARLEIWRTRISEVTYSSWLSFRRNSTNFSAPDPCVSSMDTKDIPLYFDTVLTFRTLMENQALLLLWTIVMSLRLLLSDMLTFTEQTNAATSLPDSRHKLQDHRRQLMSCALQVLQTLCYATHPDIDAANPFACITAFQLTVAVLERECRSLRATGGSTEQEIRRCEGLKALAVRYVDWVTQNKIPVKIESAY